jgi:hypothetical protein
MVYNTQNYRVFGLFPSSGIPETRKHDVSEHAQHAYEEGHRGGWDDARILEIESISRYRKYKESAHMACLTNPVSQPSLGHFSYLDPLHQE